MKDFAELVRQQNVGEAEQSHEAASYLEEVSGRYGAQAPAEARSDRNDEPCQEGDQHHVIKEAGIRVV